MWSSPTPLQCGKYVASGLNLIFTTAIALRAEISIPELTIPADEFMQEPEFEQLLTYKRLTPLLLKKIKAKEKVEDSLLKEYGASNPSFYYVYEVLGNYYEAIRQPQQAVGYWKKALTRPIPKLQEKERIQQKIQKHS